MTGIRMTHATALILKAVAAGYAYGFDIMDVTGLPSGTVYPALRRLEKAGHLTSDWETPDKAHGEGRPRRKLYGLTRDGRASLEAAHRRLAEVRSFLAEGPDGAREGA